MRVKYLKELDNNIADVADRISTPALLENTAEEFAEATHACLKWARITRGENPTDKSVKDAAYEAHEEIADVMNMIAALRIRGMLDMTAIAQMRQRKINRWQKRLEGIENN